MSISKPPGSKPVQFRQYQGSLAAYTSVTAGIQLRQDWARSVTPARMIRAKTAFRTGHCIG
eukprot:1827393-Rhodomonas_salina.2